MPTITFEVDLETVNHLSHSRPGAPTDALDNFRETRVTWLPDKVRNNIELKHGDQFTVKGYEATYLKDNFTTGEGAWLSVVSEGLVFDAPGEAVTDFILGK